MIEVAITEVGRHELTFAAGVLGRGFRDNPITVAVVGGDPLRRMRGAERALGSAIALMGHPPLGARRGAWVVGVGGMAPPGPCHPPLLRQLRMVPAMLRSGPVVMSRYLRMLSAWEKQDPTDRHWHLGPGAVEPGLPGMSIGGAA